jgi:dienelactone hydrolase
LAFQASIAGAKVSEADFIRERRHMARATWWTMLGGLVLLGTACDDEPATDAGLLADAAGPAVIWDATTGLVDAQAPDAALPGVDTGVIIPLADSGVIGPSPGDAGRADTGVTSGDAGGSLPDAQAGDSATPTGDASTPRFPAVTDTGAKGPYTPVTVNATGPSGGYTVYHPAELAPGGALNPIVSWGNGGATFPDWYPLLPHLASHGFVVIASNNPLVGGDDVRAGLDWIVQQNDTAASPFYKKLDVRNVAGVGYSNGGLATLDVANDPRFVTIVIISGGNVSAELRTANMPKLRTPTAYLCTEDEASQGNCAADFAAATVPAFFGVMKGSGHVDVVFVESVIDLLNVSTTAWLRWHQMGDQSLKTRFVGGSCGLCTDSKWTVQQKNLQ